MHSDAMRQTRAGFGDYVERRADETEGKTSRRALTRTGLVAAGTGAAVLAASANAFAASGPDVSILQTSAAIENLAVATYKTALTLDFIGGASANATVKAFAMKTMSQHTEHGQAFNAMAKQLGGAEQKGTPAKYKSIVDKALPGIKGAADVVGLALTLEQVAAQTYVSFVSQASDTNTKVLLGSVAPVEAQHVTILLEVQALLAAKAPQLIAVPLPDGGLAQLPGIAGSLGFPDKFYPVAMAASPDDGKV